MDTLREKNLLQDLWDRISALEGLVMGTTFGKIKRVLVTVHGF